MNEKLNQLKEKRDQLYKEAQEVQKEIDKLTLDEAKFTDYLGKYVIYKFPDDSEIYMHVTRIEKLTGGAKLMGPVIDCSLDSDFICARFDSEDTIHVKTSEKDNITEITKTEFVNTWKKFVYNYEKLIEQ